MVCTSCNKGETLIAKNASNSCLCNILPHSNMYLGMKTSTVRQYTENKLPTLQWKNKEQLKLAFN